MIEVMRIITGLASVASAVAIAVTPAAGAGTAAFPPSIYPSPVPARPGAALTACPNPSGLQRFTTRGIMLAKQVASTYGKVSLAEDLRHSDPSWWPTLRKNWRAYGTHGAWISFPVVRSAEIGGPKMYWAGVVRHYCGSKLLTDSLNVVVGRRVTLNCDCNGVNLLLVDRHGVPLVYDVH
jgi:hypothetical protein